MVIRTRQSRRRVVALALFLMALAYAVSCGSRRPPPVDPPIEPVPTAPLHVRVLDVFSQQPIADARIDVQAISGEDDGRTDADGYFGVVIPIVTEGQSWVLETHAAGYVSDSRPVPFTGEWSEIVRLVPIARAPWAGQLRVGPGFYADGNGAPVLPLCAHFGEAFSAYVHRKTVDGIDVSEQLRRIRAAGYDCIRFWDNLGEYSGGWLGKEVSPWSWVNRDGVHVRATPNYYGQLDNFLRLLKGIGLTAQHSRGDLGRFQIHIPGGVGAVVAHSERVAAIYDAIGLDALALYEGNNEDFQNGNVGPEGMRRIVQPLAARGAITASSCPAACTEEHDDIIAYTTGFGTRYKHGYRHGHFWDRFRHAFTFSYEAPGGTPYLGWEGEPIGPNNFAGLGVTVNHTEDVEELGLFATMNLMSRNAYTYMSQAGVFWEYRIERHSGFYAVPRMRARLHQFAPDVMAWHLTHGGRADAVLVSPIGYQYDGGPTEGPSRIDQAIRSDGRRVVAHIYGGRGRKPIQNRMGCEADLTLVHPNADESISETTISLAPGQSVDLDYRIGRMVLAACR